MARPRYRTLPHTADVRLRVWGADAAELIRHAVLGAQSVVLGRAPRGTCATWVEVERWPTRLEAQLVRAVNEALFHLFARRHVTLDVVPAAGGASLGLAPLAPRAVLRCEVKAATFHALGARRAGGRLSVELVLDL